MASIPPRHRSRPFAWTHQDVRIPGPRTVRSIEKHELNVVFQPIVSLLDGSTYSWETLVRCTVPGFEAPPVLFQAAVAEKACGRLGRLIREVAFERGAGHPLFVNIHPAELASRWLVQPDDPMNFHDAGVFLEITESATFEHFELCWNVLREIRQRASVRFVVDDLGAGHSNLKRVLDLEPSVVKLDISLVKGIDRSARQFALVRSLVSLFADLGATVVAEGIETLQELRKVREAGVHFGQGYFLARPAWPMPEIHWPFR